MISAFGIEHTISKGLSAGQLRGLKEASTPKGMLRNQSAKNKYAEARLNAHHEGKTGSKLRGQTNRFVSRHYEGKIPKRKLALP